jgi:phosphoglycolate phosphatase
MKIEKRPKALLFDLDGTLADTLPQLAKAACTACEACGITPPSYEAARTYVGNGVWMLLERCIMGRRDIVQGTADKALLQRTREAFNKAYLAGLSRDYEVFPGVREGLAAFRNAGIKLGVCSNKPQMFAVPLLGHMGLAPLFDFILGGEVISRRKPDPAPVLYACGRLGAWPSEAMMVGDSENDVLGGQNAGMPSAFLTYGYYAGDPKAISPDVSFDTFGDLANFIMSLPV